MSHDDDVTNIRRDLVWRNAASVQWYLASVRGALPFSAEHLSIMLRFVAAAGRPVHRFLDVGAGNGFLSAGLLAHYPTAEGVLVDFSPPMLAAARTQLTAATPAHLIEADLASASWRDQVTPLSPFDAVVSGFAIHHLPDPRKQALYREIYDLLAPGATFVNIEHVAPDAAWINAAFDDAVIDSITAFRQQGADDISHADIAAEYAQRPDQEANILTPVDVQCDWLRDIGFQDVAVPFRWYEIAIFGGRRALT